MAQAAQKAGGLATRLVNTAKGIQSYSTPRLQTFWKYAKVELRPPTLSEMPQVQEGINNIIVSARTGKWKKFTVKESLINTVIVLECIFCFTLGEIIGKRSVVGYNIPGAFYP
ncbi:ATP synthase subunit g, mitochondrial-like [Patella vulgata]|uniref:ATP synthase subunit g, mitochondrial-like n=1 Tax=Patella vulgata TaxID=6465 RepID=UPI0024A7BFD2|nr:ATP synthase subunit g, mitochondrial-like [Patella vulgata]